MVLNVSVGWAGEASTASSKPAALSTARCTGSATTAFASVPMATRGMTVPLLCLLPTLLIVHALITVLEEECAVMVLACVLLDMMKQIVRSFVLAKTSARDKGSADMGSVNVLLVTWAMIALRRLR